jgi:hypothetical protein
MKHTIEDMGHFLTALVCTVGLVGFVCAVALGWVQ